MLPAGLFVSKAAATIVVHSPVWDCMVEAVLVVLAFLVLVFFGLGGAGGGASES